MAPIKSCEDPTVRFAKLFAMLYYHMFEQLCRELGEERGKKAIEQAVFEFGRERIRAMHEEARERGIEVMDNPSYHLLRDMPNIGWINSERGVEYCPFANVWKDHGKKGLEYGALYCEIDHQVFSSFGLKLHRDHILTTTEDYCEFDIRPGDKQNEN